MTLALMRCCGTTPVLGSYESATDALLAALGVAWVELDFNCCGYPLRNVRFEAYVRSSARNLALADTAGLDLLTACSCCYGSVKGARRLLDRDATLRDAANEALAQERLVCTGKARVRHLLEVLRDDVGIDELRARRQLGLEGLKVACHYGCHLLRPSDVVDLGDPAAPVLLDQIVEATGAESVAWSAKLDCCGSPVSGVDEALSRELVRRKLQSARAAGADVLCVVCPYCQLQLENVQARLVADGAVPEIPIVLVHQLVAATLGVPADALGLRTGRLPATALHPVSALRPTARGARHA